MGGAGAQLGGQVFYGEEVPGCGCVPDELGGSPAERAGLRPDDVIVRFQDEAVETSTRLLNLISYYQVGEDVTVDIWRDGRRRRLTIRVGRRPG